MHTLGAAQWSKHKSNFDHLQDGHSHAVIDRALSMRSLSTLWCISIYEHEASCPKEKSHSITSSSLPTCSYPGTQIEIPKVLDPLPTYLPTYLILSLQARHHTQPPSRYSNSLHISRPIVSRYLAPLSPESTITTMLSHSLSSIHNTPRPHPRAPSPLTLPLISAQTDLR